MINFFSSLALSPSSATPGVVQLTYLPYDLLLIITEFLSVKDFVNLRRVCKTHSLIIYVSACVYTRIKLN